MRDKKNLLIGTVASQAGVNPKTIRYYEQLGLLPAPARTEAGYRLYSAEVLKRLSFIKKAQNLGLRLSEIKDILGVYDYGRSPCPHLQALFKQKIDEINQKVSELLSLKGELNRLLAQWDGASGSAERPDTTICPHVNKTGEVEA